MKESDLIRQRLDRIESKLTNQRELLTFKAAQQYLGFSAAYLHRLCYMNKIPHHKPTGRKLFFFKDELHLWIEGRKNNRTRVR